MRRIGLILLSSAVMLSAVEWNVEQVTDNANLYNLYPTIAFLPEGEPVILFEQNNDIDYFYLKKALKTGDSWTIEDLLDASDIGTFRFDIDSEGNLFVIFTTYKGQEDLFLATDTSGEMVVHRLTDDAEEEGWPIIHLDQTDEVQIFFFKSPPSSSDRQPFYGYFNEDGFQSEQIVELTESTLADFVLDTSDLPHVFYDRWGNIWHAYRDDSGWLEELVYESTEWEAAEYPSTAVDASGYFHVAYELSGSPIGYSTNKGGPWYSEYVWSDAENPRVNEDLAIDVDPLGNPHLAWAHAYDMESQYDIYYGTKLPGGWSHEPVTNSPDADEFWPEEHFFRIDAQGYGHMVYSPFEYETEQVQVHYAKSKEPLAPGIAEEPSQTSLLKLEVIGSKVYFSLPQTGPIRLDLFDAAGRRVRNLASDIYPQGEHSLPINTAGLSSGVYFVRLVVEGRSESAKFILMR